MLMALLPIILKVGLWGISTFFVGSEKKRQAKKRYIAYWEFRIKNQTGSIDARDMEEAQLNAFKKKDAAVKKALAHIAAVKKKENLDAA